MPKIARFLLIGAVLCCMVLLTTPALHAQEATPVDVALVIDSSGSMKWTDPNNLRIAASKLFISLLDQEDIASVIHFSGEAVSLSEPLPANEANKRKLQAAVGKVPSNGRYTNLYAALQQGLEVLAQHPERTQPVILLLSDGDMDTGNAEQDMLLDTKLRTELLSALRSRGITVYTVALTAESDLQLMDQIARDTGGTFGFAPSDKEVQRAMTSVIEQIKKPNRLPSQGQIFVVDDSVKELTIVIDKKSPRSRVRVQSPDGRIYSAAAPGEGVSWVSSPYFESMTTRRVVPGTWTILSAEAGEISAYIATDLKLVTRVDPPHPVQGQTVRVEAWLEQRGTKLTEPGILEKTSFYASLVGPASDGGRRLEFSDDGSRGDRQKGDGIYTLEYTPPGPGPVRLDALADGTTFSRASPVFFEVSATRPPTKPPQPSPAPQAPEPRKAPEQGREAGGGWSWVIGRFVILNLVLLVAAAIAYYLIRRRNV